MDFKLSYCGFMSILSFLIEYCLVYEYYTESIATSSQPGRNIWILKSYRKKNSKARGILLTIVVENS